MTVLSKLDRFLLFSSLGKNLLGPVVATGAAMLLDLPADPQPSPVLAGHITLVLLVICSTWYEVRRSELERAANEACSRDSENRPRELILTARYETAATAERAEEAAVGALRSSLCGLESHAAGTDTAAATTARAYLALLEGEGLTLSPAEPAAGPQSQETLG
jgi:hypothetical protein